MILEGTAGTLGKSEDSTPVYRSLDELRSDPPSYDAEQTQLIRDAVANRASLGVAIELTESLARFPVKGDEG